ncbi:HAD family hydrolase [Thalassospira sp.]|uniref:HAD family hydrolase n=1 Tax=Thalassospira sp. TaxID=1912094 RepID=UPI0027325E47|nr:HAD family hydrolase [Thalassospira sp.]MDP2698427.1 HAD family hydrolase [Thalassospira sp.]
MTQKSKIQLLVCDLDNTIYDWISYFVPAFYAMIDKAVSILECDRELLLDQMRDVHVKNHDSEHPFALLDTDIVKNRFPKQSREEIAEKLDEALYQFNSVRKQKLKLYDGIKSGIENLKEQNIKIVAHTESKLFTTIDRLHKLESFDYFDHIYCRERPDSNHPDPKAAEYWLGKFDLSNITELAFKDRKPAPHILNQICLQQGILPEQTAYIGDSIAKDILMAQRANVFAIWAKYGTQVPPEMYAKLVRISHWSKQDIAREMKLKEDAKNISPDLTVNSFSEAIQYIL